MREVLFSSCVILVTRHLVRGWARASINQKDPITAVASRECSHPQSSKLCIHTDQQFSQCYRFLWRLTVDKHLRVYKWTGKNDYVALCEPEYLSFGGGYVQLPSSRIPRSPRCVTVHHLVTATMACTSTSRWSMVALRGVRLSTTTRCALLVHGRVRTSGSNV